MLAHESDSQTLQHPYIGNTPGDRATMLDAIGVADFDALVQDIPDAYRFPALDLPDGLSELEVWRELSALAGQNLNATAMPSFIGGGAYRHFIPSTVNAILQRGEFVTSYTPYQPEAAQGTLQVGFEFQSAVCQLLDMDIANAGMYDGPTAFAEACLMACRVSKHNRVLILESADQRLVQVAESYTRYQDVSVEVVPRAELSDALAGGDVACVAWQSPNFLGAIEDNAALAEAAHQVGALAVMHTNPIACAMLKPPGAFDVDIATAEGQPLGVPLSFGGAYVGLLAAKSAHLRQLPGRIIGQTVDTQGKTGYALTLQTREQHIRRERATSNICTSTQLVGLMVAVYCATMGPAGMREAAETSYHNAHYLAERIDQLPAWAVMPGSGTADGSAGSVFFNEFPVMCPMPPAEVNRRLLEANIIGGLDINHIIPNCMLVCVTEMNTRKEMDDLVRALSLMSPESVR